MPPHLEAIAQAGADGPPFFPENAFPSGTVHELHRYFDSGALAILQEMPLGEYLASDVVAVYRFLWTPTFDPAVVVRVSDFVNGRGKVFSKMAAGQAGFEIGPIVEQRERKISRWRMGRLRQFTLEHGFWETPATSEESGLDGAGWLFEVAFPGRYHVARRWSPDAGVIHSLGMEMIRVSGLGIKSRNVY